VRFGNFEIMAAQGEMDNLRALADYVLRHHYAHLGEPSQEVYAQWFEEVCRRTAVMIAHWMSVGFVHGVMNTDNMSILGVTIDYGPYGWLEPFEPTGLPTPPTSGSTATPSGASLTSRGGTSQCWAARWCLWYPTPKYLSRDWITTPRPSPTPGTR
jgi:hypothetical protein